jgi:hypothetical protein
MSLAARVKSGGRRASARRSSSSRTGVRVAHSLDSGTDYFSTRVTCVNRTGWLP